jgi:hypothetical protein
VQNSGPTSALVSKQRASTNQTKVRQIGRFIKVSPDLLRRFDDARNLMGIKTRTKTLSKLLDVNQRLLALETKQETVELSIPILTPDNVLTMVYDTPISFVKGNKRKSYTMAKFLHECKRRDVPFIFRHTSGILARDRFYKGYCTKVIIDRDAYTLHFLKDPAQVLIKMDDILLMRQGAMKSLYDRLLAIEGEPNTRFLAFQYRRKP